MTSLFETLAQATKPDVHCGIWDRCPEEVPDCKECCRIANQSNDEEEQKINRHSKIYLESLNTNNLNPISFKCKLPE